MMSELQMGALRVLEALDGEEEVAYTVNLSNPVCPCCGAKLIIEDDTINGQNTELNTDSLEESYNQLDEQYADPSVIVPMVMEVASELVDGWTEYCRESKLDDRQIRDALCYPRDPELVEAISRKAKELKSIFSSSYGLLVNEKIIIQDIRDSMRRIASRGYRT
jgi:hypothetical protein